MELSNNAWKRLTGKVVAAERKFERDIEAARAELDPFRPWEYQDVFSSASQKASLKFFSSVLFAWLDELSPILQSLEDLRYHINCVLTRLRKEVIDEKWPNSYTHAPIGKLKNELGFDGALIEWLEGRRKWQEYEARILPAVEDSANSALHGTSPAIHFIKEPLQRLTPVARTTLRASLLKTQAGFQDGVKTPLECWREAYDIIATEFDEAKLLSDELLDESIPRMVADASDTHGWGLEPMGKSIPSAIYNVQFGSQFLPPWRVEVFRESLKGRISYWRGQLMLYPTSVVEGGTRRGRPPKSEEHRRVASIVAKLGREWKGPDSLRSLAEQMDSDGIPLDTRSRTDGAETWMDKLDLGRINFVKAIEYRLKQAKK